MDFNLCLMEEFIQELPTCVQEQHVKSFSVYFPVGKCWYCLAVPHGRHLYEVSFARERLQTFTAIGKVLHKA